MMAKKKSETKPPDQVPEAGLLPEGYEAFLSELEQRIRSAQLRATLAVNREMLLLYWRTGRDILARQKEHGWGAKVIDRLSQDLRREFPGVEGFSSRNLKYMRAFAQAWAEEPIVREALAQITWYHNLTLLEKVKRPEERLWYARKIVENGWSRNVLVHWIESDLYERQGKAQAISEKTLPAPSPTSPARRSRIPTSSSSSRSAAEAEEKELEDGLLAHIRKFLSSWGRIRVRRPAGAARRRRRGLLRRSSCSTTSSCAAT